VTTALPDRFGRGRAGVLAAALVAVATTRLLAAGDSDWFARTWQSDDGLPNNTVTGLAQTPDGFLWIATPDGLTRFDGVHFEQFSLGFAGQTGRGILTMSPNPKGGLILAVDRGAVLSLNSGRAQIYTSTNGLRDLDPKTVAEDGEGTLWIAYRGGAVFQIRSGKVTPITEQDGLPLGRSACSFAIDNSGQMWFFKTGHFGRFQDGRLVTAFLFDPFSAILAPAQDGGVWICAGPHLYKYRKGSPLEDLGEFNAGRAGNEPTVVLEDDSGAVWIGTSVGGLFRHDADGFQSVATSHSQILSLAEDHEGNIWAGTGGGGLDLIRPRTVQLESIEAGSPSEAVLAVCEDRNGALWATTQNGDLEKRMDGRWSAIPTNAVWPGGATCLAADPSGPVWVGTRHHGLFCWTNGGFVPWTENKNFGGQIIHALLVSRSGDLWIGEGASVAVQRVRAGRMKDFVVPRGLQDVRAIVEDAGGSIWLGTARGALLRVKDDQLSDLTPQSPDPPLSIRCFQASADGCLWIGYASWGLARFKDGTLARIGLAQGLYDEHISRIVADDHGWLWFGSNRGIFKVRESDLNDVADGRATRVRSVPYGRGEGLPGMEASFGDSPGGLYSRDGRVWMPMSTGLVVVNPDQQREEAAPLPVLMQRVVVDDQPVAWYGGVLPAAIAGGRDIFDLAAKADGLRLAPGHRRVQFDYTAMSFAAPESAQFRYRLAGLEDEWIEAGTQRSVTYPRLPSGHYRFEVKACNEDGVWNETGAELSFVVAPFIWERTWFRAAALGVFTLLVVAGVRYVSFRRLRRQLEGAQQQAALHKERARIAKDIHDDLGANLTQIALLSDFARQDRESPATVDGHMGNISAKARQAVQSLDEIVWAVNPRNDTLAQLIDYIGQFALDYLQVAGVRCRLDFPDELPDREISSDVRHGLFLVVKEALNNVVKHARADEVRLRLALSPEGLRIEIEDDGRGFEAEAGDPWADGLRNMRQRMQELGGECRIASQSGSGTLISVELPWRTRQEPV
jgi:signal transduction histidine kinase/ligand-binding sensor domain-containing protein